jgi:hypothetical protein
MGIGPDRVRSSPPLRELQELVDQLMADPVLALTIGANPPLE